MGLSPKRILWWKVLKWEVYFRQAPKCIWPWKDKQDVFLDPRCRQWGWVLNSGIEKHFHKARWKNGILYPSGIYTQLYLFHLSCQFISAILFFLLLGNTAITLLSVMFCSLKQQFLNCRVSQPSASAIVVLNGVEVMFPLFPKDVLWHQ